jgi:hypothetical protein
MLRPPMPDDVSMTAAVGFENADVGVEGQAEEIDYIV